jgi:hypothetical protein
MKVFVAGASGVLGTQLVPLLVANGHDVVGMTRTDAKRDRLRSVGAQPVVADALDANAVGRAVGEAEPEVIVHQLTAIPPALNMRRFDREFAPTNRLLDLADGQIQGICSVLNPDKLRHLGPVSNLLPRRTRLDARLRDLTNRTVLETVKPDCLATQPAAAGRRRPRRTTELPPYKRVHRNTDEGGNR